MERLYVLYDAHCGLCSWAKRWLMRQPAWIDLRFVPAGSEQSARLFPSLNRPGDPAEELVVVSDQGAVYREAAAWIMCLFALEDYRDWANRLAHPLLRPLARQGFSLLSRQRSRVSRWLSLASEFEIAQTLGQIHVPACTPEPLERTSPGPPPSAPGPKSEAAPESETAPENETSVDVKTAPESGTSAEVGTPAKSETAPESETASASLSPVGDANGQGA